MNLRKTTGPALALHATFVFLFLLGTGISGAMAASAVMGKVALDASTGGYTVSVDKPSWTFAGSVGSALSNVQTTRGQDTVGKYSETSFQWSDTHPYIGSIRYYPDRASFVFSITSSDALTGPTPDFPSFSSFPARLLHLSYSDGAFSPHTFSLTKTSTPWFLFDDQGNTFGLSPASDFIVSQMHGDGTDAIASGLQPQVAALPAGFTHRVVLTVGQGIESTIHQWGGVLTALSSKPEPNDQDDPMLKYFGYWTDNGATYYYNYDLDKGYMGTLLAVQDEYKKDNIPLHYLQLDSWWYQKTRMSPEGKMGGPKNAKLPEGTWNAYGGTLDYSASPDLFPQGLKSFQQQVDLPIAVHGRWIDATSPYHAQYKISGVAPVDPKYWDGRAKYLADSGVICYEQDWLSAIYPNSPEMASNIDTGAAFTDNMARATKANHETMQYCMATPRFFLQGSKYDNLTTIRTSDDRFDRSKWNHFIYTSVLADSLNIRPWVDTFMSSELGNIIIATLSTGPVGVGDQIGLESVPNIMKVIRPDGVIVKPDVPLLPTDASIENDAAKVHLPLVASTYTNNGVRTAYVFVCTRTGDSSDVNFTPSSLGLTGQVYVTNLAGTAKKQDASAPFTDTLDTTGWNYYSVAPIGRSGIAFLGDAGKFVGTGRTRITSIIDAPNQLTAQVAFLESRESSFTLQGYSDKAPTVKATGGFAGPVQFDPATGHFTATITGLVINRPAAASLDTVTPITVVFSRK